MADWAEIINTVATTASSLAEQKAAVSQGQAAAIAERQAAAKEAAAAQAAAQAATDQYTYQLAMQRLQAAQERQRIAQEQEHEYRMKLQELEEDKIEQKNTKLYIGAGVAVLAVLGISAYFLLRKK